MEAGVFLKTVRKLTVLRLLAALVLILGVPSAVVGGFSTLLPRLMAAKPTQIDAQIVPTPMPTVVLDPGHGGADGGAVSVTGTLEKDLNLRMAQTLKRLLEASGVRVILTRDSDTMLDSEIGGSRKMKDLAGRLQIMNGQPEALFVSLHMNRFPSPSCKGTQVWYAQKDPEAKLLADAIAAEVKASLQPENHRQSKKADENIYLLHRASTCAVLVECGFLSCPEEAAMLEDPVYHERLAAALTRGILTRLTARENTGS